MIALGIGIGLVAGAVIMAALYLWMRPDLVTAIEGAAHLRRAYDAAEFQLTEARQELATVRADRDRLQREVDATAAIKRASADRCVAAGRAQAAAERAQTEAQQALHRANARAHALESDLKTIAAAARVPVAHPDAAALVVAEIARLKGQAA